jgi:hypothetical protein
LLLNFKEPAERGFNIEQVNTKGNPLSYDQSNHDAY